MTRRTGIQYNGDWALTKGNTFYDEEKGLNKALVTLPAPKSSLSTSTVHQIIEQNFDGHIGRRCHAVRFDADRFPCCSVGA